MTLFCSYIQKFYQMKTQLQAVSLRIQTVRSNEQMMQSMKGATSLLGSMNRSMNLPALQRIAMDFERENDIMEQRQEMMDDAIDDVTGLDDEMESDEIVNQVLDEIGVEMNHSVCHISAQFSFSFSNVLTHLFSSARRNTLRYRIDRRYRGQGGTGCRCGCYG
jgi:division protein CdvB (Snf7/Vps24/ESCRT-III family)